MSLILSSAMALRLLKVTDAIWSQKVGDVNEPLEHAWKRLFGEPMSVPMLFQAVKYEGRDLVVRLHPRGRVSVSDPALGHHIRVMKRRDESVAQVAGELVSLGRDQQELTQRFQDGRVGEAALRFLCQV